MWSASPTENAGQERRDGSQPAKSCSEQNPYEFSNRTGTESYGTLSAAPVPLRRSLGWHGE